MTGRPEKDARLERLAAQVDEDAGVGAPSDEADRRTLDQLRALRDALRAAGPAKASAGFAERVLERVAEEERMVKLFAQRARRDRVLVWVQAASLAALFLAYGGLLALTRVNHVGPRWQEQPAASARPDAQASVDEPALAVQTAGFGLQDGPSEVAAPESRFPIPEPRPSLSSLLPRRTASG
jgi:hypothetical protein